MEQINKIREALKTAASVFEKYSDYHKAKNTSDGDRKAWENGQHFAKCVIAIAELDELEERLGSEELIALVSKAIVDNIELEDTSCSPYESFYRIDEDSLPEAAQAAINVIRGGDGTDRKRT